MSAEREGQLSDRVAIVTGAAGGQGRAVALRFAAEGAAVAICDVDREGLEQTCQLLDGVSRSTFAQRVDLTSVEEIRRFVDAAAQELGGIDIVYNNAGVSVVRPLREIDEPFWDLVYAVNVKSQLFMIQAAYPFLSASRAASVINVSSAAGDTGVLHQAAYCSSKGAVNTLTKALAVELAEDHIRVNCIAPGLIRTPLVERSVAECSPEERDSTIARWTSRQIQRRLGEPEEIAAVAVFLASDASSYITGEIVNASGGWAAA